MVGRGADGPVSRQVRKHHARVGCPDRTETVAARSVRGRCLEWLSVGGGGVPLGGVAEKSQCRHGRNDILRPRNRHRLRGGTSSTGRAAGFYPAGSGFKSLVPHVTPNERRPR